MACERCRLKKACKHIPGPFCPWMFYIFLLVLIGLPIYLLVSSLHVFNF